MRSAIIFIIGAAAFIFCMYHPGYSGMISTGGGDAADHIYYRYKFLHETPNIYHGFVSFFIFSDIVERIFALTPFESFRAVFYLTGILIFLFVSVVAGRVSTELWDSSNNRSRYSFLLIVLAILPCAKIAFPLLSYLQSEGFYPHLFGLVPLFAGWCFYSITQKRSIRILILLATLVLYRYTYGLNLADLIGAVGILIFLELRNIHSIIGVILRVATISITLAAAFHGYTLFSTLLDRSGGILHHRFELVAIANLISGCLLIIAANRLKETSPAIQRNCLFAGSFAVISASVALICIALELPIDYYIYKYNFHSTILIIFALLIFATAALNELTLKSSHRIRNVGLLAVAFLALFVLKNGYEIIRPHYAERVSRTTTPQIIEPLADTEADKLIRQVLIDNSSAFGGFISTPLWALSGFMNATFSYYHYNMPRLYSTGRLRLKPGYCVFWNSGLSDRLLLEKVGSKSVLEKLDLLAKDPKTKHVTYKVAWQNEDKELSYLCS